MLKVKQQLKVETILKSLRKSLKSPIYGDISVEEVSLAMDKLKPGKPETDKTFPEFVSPLEKSAKRWPTVNCCM